MKKAILKRTADAMEKLAIGSMLVGLFQGQRIGIMIGLYFLVMSYLFTQRAVKPRPSGRGYKAHLNWNFCLFVCAAID